MLKKEGMDREIKSVESEFQGQFVSDYARIEQLLCENTADKRHYLNCFAWGNLKSLKGDNEETLWDDLKNFYESQYSADRLKVVIQVKTDDDLAELRQWVTESFGIIEDKNYGP